MNTPPPQSDLNRYLDAARRCRMDTHRTEWAFETRLMARIRNEQKPLLLWWTTIWKVMPLFLLLIVLLGEWNLTSDAPDDNLDLATAIHPELHEQWIYDVLADNSL